MTEPKPIPVIEPGQSWEIDLFRPEDSAGVAQLFRTVYGEDYPVKTYLNAQLLVEENGCGNIISSVARTPRGDIVGHCCLFRTAPFSSLYESGAGLVHSAYRGGSIAAKLAAHGTDVAAKEFKVAAVFGEPVCNHVFMQKVTASLGWLTCALEVDLMPAEAYNKEQSASGRVSALLAFLSIEPRPQKVFLPERYRDTLLYCYSGFNEPREFAASKEKIPSAGSTGITAQFFEFAGVARLAVHDTSHDFETVFDRQEAAVLAGGAVVIQVWLKLSWPWAGHVAELLRDRGYFIGGALPRWFDDDGMLLQKTLVQPNWEGIKLHEDRARVILGMVREDRLMSGSVR